MMFLPESEAEQRRLGRSSSGCALIMLPTGKAGGFHHVVSSAAVAGSRRVLLLCAGAILAIPAGYIIAFYAFPAVVRCHLEQCTAKQDVSSSISVDDRVRSLGGCPAASKVEYDSAKREYLLISRGRVYYSGARWRDAAAASGGDGVARPPRQRRRHSRLGQRRPTSAPSNSVALLKLKNETAIWNRRLARRARA